MCTHMEKKLCKEWTKKRTFIKKMRLPKMSNVKAPKQLPLTHALAYLIASTLVFTGGGYAAMKSYLERQQRIASDPKYALTSILQTGPQKEALKTEYLAELLGASVDCPYHAKRLNQQRAKERLQRSPLIAKADIKVIDPGTLYVDYTVRQPIAFLEDYKNVAIDKEGRLIPFAPFFTPKNLPAIYLGLAPFGTAPPDPDRPQPTWEKPIEGRYASLALDLLAIFTDPKMMGLSFVKRIDISNAFAESYGKREIVVIAEDVLFQNIKGTESQVHIPYILRLSTKDYAQDLGNYLKLREQILEEESKKIAQMENGKTRLRLKEKILDFRIGQLAFIESYKDH